MGRMVGTCLGCPVCIMGVLIARCFAGRVSILPVVFTFRCGKCFIPHHDRGLLLPFFTRLYSEHFFCFYRSPLTESTII
jgi:hypothetical protein